MNRDEFNRNLTSNIQISEDAKRKLYENCKNGKSTADFRFKHSGALFALAVTCVIGSAGLGVKAYYESVAKHLEQMPETERASYADELKNDVGVTISDSWSRELTNQETLRLAALERDAYEHGVFPEGELPRLKSLSEWDGKTLAYVEEDHLLHLPEEEMTDEQLLMFIDHSRKYDYVIMQEAAKDNQAQQEESPYAEVSASAEGSVEELAYRELTKFLGEELGEEWRASVKAFTPSKVDPEVGTGHDNYTVTWQIGEGSSFGKDYVVVLGANDLALRAAGIRGREHWATLGSYDDEEAMEIAGNDEKQVLAWIEDLYGYANPDEASYKPYHEYDDVGDARQILYCFQYGRTEVMITWDLSTKQVSSVDVWKEEWN